MEDQSTVEVGDKNNDDVRVTEGKSFLVTWRWLWAPAIGIYLAWVPFYGYTYLIKKLEYAGFDGVDINPKTYDLVYYFLEGWTDPITKALSFPDASIPWELVYKIMMFGGLVGLSFILFSFLNRWFSITTNKESSVVKPWSIKASKVFINAAYSFKDSLLLFLGGIVSTSLVVLLEILGLFFIFLLGALLWLLALTGVMSGWKSGSELVKNPICNERPWNDSEINRGYGHSCSQIKIDGKFKEGHRIYSDSNSTFFVTNEGAYQVNNVGEKIYFKTITRIKSAEVNSND